MLWCVTRKSVPRALPLSLKQIPRSKEAARRLINPWNYHIPRNRSVGTKLWKYRHKIELFTLIGVKAGGAPPVVFQSSAKDSNQVEESHGALRSVLGAASITSNHFSLKNVLRQWFVSRACRSENNAVTHTYIWTIIRRFLFLFFFLSFSRSLCHDTAR